MLSSLRRLGAAGALLLLAALGGAAWLGFEHWRQGGVSAVRRGRVLADRSGCFGCHGPGGLTGFEDPAGTTGAVPPFDQEAVESHARTPAEIREWIADGRPRRLREMDEKAGEEEQALLRMPAFGQRLSPAEIDDLVAFVRATSGYQASAEPAAVAGREAAARLGCFTCHGPQGRDTPPNPGSFKGYIPSWDGPDLPELARDDAELREWILDGSPKRLREHPIARRFIAGQAVKMPAYRGHIAPEDVELLVAYVRWLRTSPEARQGR